MGEHDLELNLGTLCSCCDYHSFRLPDVEGFTARQRKVIEDLCKLCIESLPGSDTIEHRLVDTMPVEHPDG